MMGRRDVFVQRVKFQVLGATSCGVQQQDRVLCRGKGARSLSQRALSCRGNAGRILC